MNMYRDNLMDHYKNPRNFGTIPNAQIVEDAQNPFCGDKVHIELSVDNGVITDFKFNGDMCAIAMAGASMLSEEIVGEKVSVVKSFSKEQLLEFFGTDLTTSRVKCATLVLEALASALKDYD